MTAARFYVADMTGARFEQVNMSGVMMRGAELFDVDITGEVWNLTSTAWMLPRWSRPNWTDATRTGPRCARSIRRVPRGVGHRRTAVGRNRGAGPASGPAAAARVGERRVLDDLTDETLTSRTAPVTEPPITRRLSMTCMPQPGAQNNQSRVFSDC